MSLSDAEHELQVLAVAQRRPRLAVRLTFGSCAAMLTAGVAWAHLAVHDVVARADGIIVPSEEIHLISGEEGGVLREVLVTNGQHVSQGQVIARFESPGFTAEAGSRRVHRLVLAADAARLEAEADDTSLTMPAEVAAGAPAAVQREKALYRVRKAQLASSVYILRRQWEERQSELSALQEREKTVTRSLGYLQQQLAMDHDLAAKGLTSRSEMLKLERQVSDAEGDAATIQNNLAAAQAAVEEASQRMEERNQAFHGQALEDLGKVRADIAAVDASLVELADRMAHHDIRAPRDGVVKRMLIEAGSLVAPGTAIAEETSIGADLLIKGKVRLADLALLRPGQTASVQVSDKGLQGYGVLSATLEQVDAADGSGPGAGTPYVMKLDPKQFVAAWPLAAHAGMSAKVDIVVGRESLLDYVLAPIRQVRQQIALVDH